MLTRCSFGTLECRIGTALPIGLKSHRDIGLETRTKVILVPYRAPDSSLLTAFITKPLMAPVLVELHMVSMIRSDLDFILAQIKIAEADVPGADLVASGLIPNPELPWGLRRVDGSNNNLVAGQGNYGAADQPFPRDTDPSYTTGTGGQPFGPPITNLFGPPVPGPGIDFGFLTNPNQPAGPTNPPLPSFNYPQVHEHAAFSVREIS
jgi:hypothetical protein